MERQIDRPPITARLIDIKAMMKIGILLPEHDEFEIMFFSSPVYTDRVVWARRVEGFSKPPGTKWGVGEIINDMSAVEQGALRRRVLGDVEIARREKVS